MAWSSISSITKEYGLLETDSFPVIIGSLKKQLASIHPDKNGGKFNNDDEEKRYHLLREAIEFVEEQMKNDNALVLLNRLPAIIESISDAIAKKREPTSAEITSAFIVDYKERNRRQLLLPKITSGILAGISSFLFFFAGQLNDHPVLKNLFSTNEKIIPYGTLYLSFIFGISFVMCWFMEGRSNEKVEFLMSDAGLNDFFRFLCAEMQLKDGMYTFSSNKIRRSGLFENRFHIHDHTVIDKLISINIQKLIERKIVKEIERPDLDRWYEIDQTIIQKYKEDIRNFSKA